MIVTLDLIVSTSLPSQVTQVGRIVSKVIYQILGLHPMM